MATTIINTSEGWKEVCSGSYDLCRKESEKWVMKGFETNIITKSLKSTHRYAVSPKKRIAKNYNPDFISLNQLY